MLGCATGCAQAGWRIGGAVNELALFAGVGGGILGGHQLGWRTVCAVELDPYARNVLIARQNDGNLPPFPIWDDVRTFDGYQWSGLVDVVSGGFPCQDISIAGKGDGIDGAKSGLWREMARIIDEVRPRFVFVENSPELVHRGLARILGDLASMGFDARWGVVGAHHAGAPHKRDRIWVCANTTSPRSQGQQRQQQERHNLRPADMGAPKRASSNINGEWQQQPPGSIQEFGRRPCDMGTEIPISDPVRHRCARGTNKQEPQPQCGPAANSRKNDRWWAAEPNVARMAHGVPFGMDRVRCLGNAQVPAQAALAWQTLTELD